MGLEDDEKRVGGALREAYERRALTGKPEGFRIVLDVVATMLDIERRNQIEIPIDKRYGGPLGSFGILATAGTQHPRPLRIVLRAVTGRSSSFEERTSHP